MPAATFIAREAGEVSVVVPAVESVAQQLRRALQHTQDPVPIMHAIIQHRQLLHKAVTATSKPFGAPLPAKLVAEVKRLTRRAWQRAHLPSAPYLYRNLFGCSKRNLADLFRTTPAFFGVLLYAPTDINGAGYVVVRHTALDEVRAGDFALIPADVGEVPNTFSAKRQVSTGFRALEAAGAGTMGVSGVVVCEDAADVQFMLQYCSEHGRVFATENPVAILDEGKLRLALTPEKVEALMHEAETRAATKFGIKPHRKAVLFLRNHLSEMRGKPRS